MLLPRIQDLGIQTRPVSPPSTLTPTGVVVAFNLHFLTVATNAVSVDPVKNVITQNTVGEYVRLCDNIITRDYRHVCNVRFINLHCRRYAKSKTRPRALSVIGQHLDDLWRSRKKRRISTNRLIKINSKYTIISSVEQILKMDHLFVLSVIILNFFLLI